ncbi:MAG: hypothetical protein IJZ83_01865 [Clostridia bacterium]|nr:hypothetical protein [Clostridia bacterium]
MKTKNIALIILAAVIIIPLALILFDFGSLDFSFNFKKYHTCEVDGREFEFYGSFGRIGKIKVSDDNGKICSLSFSADADIFKRNIPAVETFDINSDGNDDILVLCGIDEENDVHRSLFIATASDYNAMGDTDIVNFRIEDDLLISEDGGVEYLAETVEKYVVPNRKHVTRRDYKYYDGEIIIAREYSLSYYSETDIYCHGYWEYDEDSESLLCVDEDWLLPDEYEKERENLQKLFKIQLP